ncbi:hypothetical protein SAMN05216388_10459 [Halorientalis persicus]|uniref:Uncharacterized protein n=1 Tax=Halorientalis persicus TaxID=1367881 RepID=A0A1H8W1A8_9EURY|nr:hypothetical protein [Halorientalis persicus]SEP20968.1 hypothetical protein SAMN05216388_10459 [Halorientalis persicus]
MSDRLPSVISSGDVPYTAVDRVEERSQRLPSLLALGLVVAGLFLQGDLIGATVGIALVVVWVRLRIEFVFATGVFAFTSLGGTPEPVPVVLTIAGLIGLLAVELAIDWKSVQLVVLFGVLLALIMVASFIDLDYLSVGLNIEIGLHWIGVMAITGFALTAYALHRYQNAFRKYADPYTHSPEIDDFSSSVKHRSDDTGKVTETPRGTEAKKRTDTVHEETTISNRPSEDNRKDGAE